MWICGKTQKLKQLNASWKWQINFFSTISLLTNTQCPQPKSLSTSCSQSSSLCVSVPSSKSREERNKMELWFPTSLNATEVKDYMAVRKQSRSSQGLCRPLFSFFLHLVQPSLSSHKVAYDNKASSSPTEGSSVKTQCTLRIREALPPSSCWLGIKVHFILTFNGQHVESTPYKWHRPWLESQQQFILHPGFPPVIWHKQIWPFFIPSRFKSSRSVILCGWHHEKNPEPAHCNRTSWALDLTLTHTRTHTSARWQASAVDHHFPFDKSNQMEPEKKKMKAVQRRSH